MLSCLRDRDELRTKSKVILQMEFLQIFDPARQIHLKEMPRGQECQRSANRAECDASNPDECASCSITR